MNINSKSKVLTKNLSAYPKDSILTAALQASFDLNLPIAFWRIPNTTELNLTVSFKPTTSIKKVDIEDLSEGFVFAPFDIDNKKTQFIEANFSLSFDFEEVIETRKTVDEPSSEVEVNFRNTFTSYLDQGVTIPNYHFKPDRLSSSNSDFESLVQKCIEEIERGSFDKIVPARTKRIDLEGSFSPVQLLLNLIESYPSAFVSLVSIPTMGTWIGATPEVLIEKSGDSFKTVALAGTQRADEAKRMSDTAWTQKEIEEQAMVSRYIINCFKKIRLREYLELGPKTIKAGNLLHLKTTYEVDTKATNFPELATIMLELLHPTSAVAGMPKVNVLPFLKEHEGFDRDFFSGFLGPINVEKKTHLFVNLRCMQLLERAAILYAGAGVTSDSDPHKELVETEIKFNTLLNVLNYNK
ncbi:chorismate-binding protein [Roseivirga sp.]|uniref:chorismate-binding protein n=1 Tax=Roseivirga sp. TaxID=1964215 RepID=UPI003B8AF340